MAQGIELIYNSNIPNVDITQGLFLFSCHEYKAGKDLSMYLLGKISGIYVVSYNFTTDRNIVYRRWLYYSRDNYRVSIGSNLEQIGLYYTEGPDFHTNYYYGDVGSDLGVVDNLVWGNIYNYPDLSSAMQGEGIIPYANYPITYRLTNCSAPSAPTEAIIGETVNVDFTFPEGYGIVNPSSDVYVTNNGVVVPSQYANGRLTFTMPDPS